MSEQQRVLFFVHDGSGLGHLRRVCRVADALQGPCASLVVTGHRAVTWMLSAACEFVHLPSWDSIDASRSRYWSRSPWIGDDSAGRRIRGDILAATFESFAPHSIVVDYHPFGRYGELRQILAASSARKYLLLRGVIDGNDTDMLCGEASAEIARVFDTIAVACDRRVIDVAASYDFDHRAAAMMTYIGYVTAEPGPCRSIVRQSAGVPRDLPWVVCSAGGGKKGEMLIEECIEAATAFPSVHFDVIVGPRSRLDAPASTPLNCRVFTERRDLPEWHAACDVLVTPGGYNSVVEGGAGGARLLVRPTQSHTSAEPREHAMRLAAGYPVSIAEDAKSMRAGLEQCLDLAMRSSRPVFPYSIEGVPTLRSLILSSRRQPLSPAL